MLMWIHEISQSALAASVAVLGLVMLLELRSIARLRRLVDGHLARLFEQLDLLRFESQQITEAQARSPAAAAQQSTPVSSLPAGNAGAAGSPAPLGASEARLLKALSAARARLGHVQGDNSKH